MTASRDRLVEDVAVEFWRCVLLGPASDHSEIAARAILSLIEKDHVIVPREAV